MKSEQKGFIPSHFSYGVGLKPAKPDKESDDNSKSRSHKNGAGFTLIELLVVVAIISLLTSVAMIAYQESRQKSRDAKRLSDMTQLANAFELYFSHNKGYPSDTADLVSKDILRTLPKAPTPSDGTCITAVDFNNNPVLAYPYYPSGTSYVLSGDLLYPDFYMAFCLGQQTGNFPPGVHYLTPTGIR